MQERELHKLIIDDTAYETKLTGKYLVRKKRQLNDPSVLKAFIPGTIRTIYVQPGKQVKRGDNLLILEAMKMQNVVVSPRDGIIRSVLVSTDEMVRKDQTLLEFE